MKTFGNKEMIEDVTYNEISRRSEKIGSYLLSRNHNVYYLYAKNCVHWSTADLACWTYGLINIPLYDTLGAEAFEYIVNVTQGSFIFSSKNTIPNLLKLLNKNKYNLKEICFFEDLSP